MIKYELNLTSNAYYKDRKHVIKNFANKLPVTFNRVTYTGDKNNNNYEKGRFSLFLKPKDSSVGYKIFIGFREKDRKEEHVKVYSENEILNVKRVYNILREHNLCPLVYNIFAVNINVFNSSYLSYGLEMQNIFKKDGGSKNKFRDFKIRLKEICENNGLRRLNRIDRRDILQGKVSTGSIDNIMYEASTKANNVVFDGEKYVLLDIDPMWVVL